MISYTSNSELWSDEAATVRRLRQTSDSVHIDRSHIDRSHIDRSRTGRRHSLSLGLVCLMIILLLLEAFVFRNVLLYGYSPGFIGQMGELQASFAAEDSGQIRVAIFGDSMSLDALRPEVMEAEAGWPRGTVFNFSLSGGSAFDMYKTYKAYEHELTGMKQAIIVVNEHQVNNFEADQDIKFKFFADFGDRLQVMNADNYGELLLGWAWKGYEMRSVWTMMLKKWWHDRGHPDETKQLREIVPAHPGGIAPLTWSPKTDKTEEHAIEVADRWFEQYDLTGVRTDALRKLVSELTARGVRVTILQIPRTAFFEQAVAERHSEESATYLALIRSIADEHGALFAVMSNEHLDQELDFRDTNHVSKVGAVKVSQEVARRWLVE